ncbi:hypothetical protein MMC19_005721 [Ptychographa xylographoides]|nr:hypothetical protein [Ptychographa xylographoides]
MAEEGSTIRNLFKRAKALRKQLDLLESTSQVYQENLQSAISALEECRKLADKVSLFSPNETEDDISSNDLQYLSIDYLIGDLVTKRTGANRKLLLRRAQEAYERYLGLLDTYSILSTSDKKLHERYIDSRDTFALLSSPDASIRRDTKIARFKQEKDLKQNLEHLAQHPSALRNDDAALRALYLAELSLYTHQTFYALDLIAQEFKILALAPPTPPLDPSSLEQDYRQRMGRTTDQYSSRLDSPTSQLTRSANTGPILSKEGKPLKPFTLLDHRQTLRNGVFRPDHTLPTMTIDEYLAEEKRRGGIIEGGGEQSGITPEVDEGDFIAADRETMKAREWDEFKEDNPKGSGNTLNRG